MVVINVNINVHMDVLNVNN